MKQSNDHRIYQPLFRVWSKNRKRYLTTFEIQHYIRRDVLALYLMDERNHSQWNSLRKEARRKFGSQFSKKTYIECIGRLDLDEEEE